MRVVVLVSGSGTPLQALIDASADPSYAVTIVAAGADRDATVGLERAARAGIPDVRHEARRLRQPSRWNATMVAKPAAYDPELMVLAGSCASSGRASWSGSG